MLNKGAMKSKALAEAKRFSVIVGYLWILFSLFELYKWTILREHNLGSQLGFKVGFSLINAIVLGKVIFVAEALRTGERLKNKPLVQPILYKSALFSVILVCFHIVEDLLAGVIHGKTIAQSIPTMGGGGLEGILIVGVIIFIVLIPFFAFREFGRVVGEDELKSLLLGRGAKVEKLQSRARQDDDRVA